jgi:ketosteroid isomerase-like protein
MSRENVEVVREMTEAFLRGDVEQALVAYDPDVEWDGRNLPDGKVARGLGAVVEHVARWAEQWEDWQYQPLDYIDAGDDVVLITRERGRSTAAWRSSMTTPGSENPTRRTIPALAHGVELPNDALRQVGLRE